MELTTFEEDRAALVAIAPVLRRLAARLDEASSAELGPLFAELDALKSAATAAKVGLVEEARVRGEAWAAGAASPASVQECDPRWRSRVRR